MVGEQLQQGRINFIHDLNSAVRQRVLDARPLKVLSDRDGKKVEVVKDVKGDQFVRRVYRNDNLTRPGMPAISTSFAEAWQARNEMFAAARIDIVPHVVFFPTSPTDRRVVVACEQVPNADLFTTSKENKMQLATGLADLLGTSERFFPSLESFAFDMFKIRRDESGEEKITLVDIDPYLTKKRDAYLTEDGKDLWFAAYLDKVNRILGKIWTRPEERYPVMSAFLRQIGPILQANGTFALPRTFDSVLAVHDTAQGVSFD